MDCRRDAGLAKVVFGGPDRGGQGFIQERDRRSHIGPRKTHTGARALSTAINPDLTKTCFPRPHPYPALGLSFFLGLMRLVVSPAYLTRVL